MKIDEAIRMFEWSAKQDRPFEYLYKWAAGSPPCDDKKTLANIAKWLKELKRLREKVRHCELVHGAVFEELEKKGVIA